MALKIYCMACGDVTLYGATKPAFCSQCGTSFDKSASAAETPLKPTKTKPKVKFTPPPVEEDDEVSEIPAIAGLEVEIAPSRVRGVSLKELVFEEKVEMGPREAKQLSEQQFKQEWEREAGTLKKGDSTEVGGE